MAIFPIIWPIFPVGVAMVWFIYGFAGAIFWVFEILNYTLWLIFAGGIVKLLGPGVFYGVALISVILICFVGQMLSHRLNN